MICEWCDDPVLEWEEFEESRMHKWCWEEANEVRYEDGDDAFIRVAFGIFVAAMLTMAVLFVWVLPEMIGAQVIEEEERYRYECREDMDLHQCEVVYRAGYGPLFEEGRRLVELLNPQTGDPVLADGTLLAEPHRVEPAFTG
jgi:hypothetical protein